MKRTVLMVGVMLLGVVGLAVLTDVAQANTNALYISQYDISYELSRDAEQRSVLRTTEKITAEFMQQNKNRGIERSIPRTYDGHSVSLDIASVTDEAGATLEYSTYQDNGNEVIRIGNPDRYVYGTQTYIITYTQRDVTRFFENTKRDEWYWDTNGTGWKVPINQLSVKLTIADDLRSALSGDTACYRGTSGSSDKCQLVQSDGTLTLQTGALGMGENITVVVGFQEGTFAEYQPSILERLFPILLTIWISITLIGVSVSVWLFVRWGRWSYRTRELGTIIPEYIPPKGTSITTSASILGQATGTDFAAQLIDFAVRRYMKIYETKPKSMWSKAEYDIEIIKDISTLLPEEQELIADIFPLTSVGSRLELKSLRNNPATYGKVSDNPQKLQALVRGSYGLRAHDELKKKSYINWAVGFSVLSILTLNPILFVFAIILFVLGYTLWPLTDKGLELYRYLLGLKLYISVAEVERLKMLQSPEGADKVGVANPNDPSQMVKLYERVLPYAILFGQEKQWNVQLGRYYESLQSSPDWLASSSGAFQAAAFSSAISSFSSSASYSAPSSSSSGGSSGGGFSGGGGGGGGGGGW